MQIFIHEIEGNNSTWCVFKWYANVLNVLGTFLLHCLDCMTAAALPSTLVKCLYLFFDLPPVENADVKSTGCEFTPMERRILLQKVFVQVNNNFLYIPKMYVFLVVVNVFRQ